MNNDIAKKRSRLVAEFYEKYGVDFAATRGFVWEEEKLIAQRIKSGMTVVDVGAGNGRFARLIEHAHYIGIEPSRSMRKSADSKLDIAEGTLPNINLECEIADVTVCFAMFHHLADEETRIASVKELIRVTKHGGLIAASAWYLNLPLPLLRKEGCGNLHLTKGEIQRGCDLFIPWRANGADAKRFVHVFDEEEWKKLWSHPDIEIEKIGMFGKKDWTSDSKEARNWFMVGRRTCFGKKPTLPL